VPSDLHQGEPVRLPLSRLASLFAVACLAVVARPAAAQDAPALDLSDTGGSSASSGSPALISTTILPTATTAGIIFGAYFTTTKDKEKAAPSKEETGKAASAWLRMHKSQLREDLARGGGRSLDQLAGLASIRPENRARFGAAMRAHRGTLLTLGDPEGLTPDRALRFLATLGEVIMQDETLSADGRAVIARLQG